MKAKAFPIYNKDKNLITSITEEQVLYIKNLVKKQIDDEGENGYDMDLLEKLEKLEEEFNIW